MTVKGVKKRSACRDCRGICVRVGEGVLCMWRKKGGAEKRR